MPRTRSQGFTLIEALVAFFIASVIFTIAFQLLVHDTKTYHTQTQIVEMRQNARSAIEFLSRDIIQVGHGFKDTPPSIPVLYANEPTIPDVFSSTAITVRSNTQDVTTALSAPMPQTSAEIKCVSVAGFVEGQRAFIWDLTGVYNIFTITQVQNSNHLQHNLDDFSKAYSPDDGTTVQLVDEVIYKLDPATLQLLRKENTGPWLIVAENIEHLKLQYWNASSVEVFPADDLARRQVKKIGVTVRARTQDKDRNSGEYRRYTMRTELTPRNLAVLPVT